MDENLHSSLSALLLLGNRSVHIFIIQSKPMSISDIFNLRTILLGVVQYRMFLLDIVFQLFVKKVSIHAMFIELTLVVSSLLSKEPL